MSIHTFLIAALIAFAVASSPSAAFNDIAETPPLPRGGEGTDGLSTVAVVIPDIGRRPAWEGQEDEQPAAEPARADQPVTTPGPDDCRPAQLHAAPGAIVVVPGTDCPVDITDPNFRPFALPN